MEYKLGTLVNIIDWITANWMNDPRLLNTQLAKMVYLLSSHHHHHRRRRRRSSIHFATEIAKSNRTIYTTPNYRKAIFNKPTSIDLLLLLLPVVTVVVAV